MLGRLLGWLLEPARPMEDVAEALRSRLLLGLLLAVIAFGVGALLVFEATSAAPSVRPELMLHALGTCLFAGAYVAGRRGSGGVARTIALGVPVLTIAAVSYWRSSETRPNAFILNLLLPIVLGTAFLTVGQAALFAAGVIALAAVLLRASPSLASDADQWNYLAYLVYLSGIVLIIARHRDRLEQARQQQLRDREAQYRLLAENITDVVFVQDMRLNPVYLSPSAEGLFGYSVAEMMKKTLADAMTPASLARAMAAFQGYVERAQREDFQIPLMQYEYVRKDGSTFTGELRVKFLRDAEGKLTGSQGVLRDISERVALEDRLRHAEKMRLIGQLAGGVAHDFNNQLAGIRGAAELLLRRREVRAPADAALLEGIIKAADRSAQLTRQLLAFARRASAQLLPTDLREVVRDVVSMLEHSIDKRIRVTQKLEDPNPVVLGDPAQLQSAVLNVALNARDAMPEGGALSFEIRRVEIGGARVGRDSYGLEPGPYLALSVRDTGHGMDPETRRRMFEPFFTTKATGEGTGMGLAVVDGTVRVHRGAIEVETNEGKGTTVTLYLPAANAQIAAAARPSPVASARGTVLVVDDEEMVRNTTAGMLRALGYQVLTCPGGVAALERYRSSGDSIDVVLLDAVMPDLAGREVLRELLALRPDASVVMVSGYSANPEEGKDQGARAFLAKPFSMEQLAHTVELARAAPAGPAA